MAGRAIVDQPDPSTVDFTNIDLTLTPVVRIVTGHTPHGHIQQIDDADSVTVACDANGRYEFPRLAKGTYRMTVIGPGIEKQERFVAVATEDSDVTIDLTVESSD